MARRPDPGDLMCIAAGMNIRIDTSLHPFLCIFLSQGKYDEALPLYRECLDIREKVLGPEHPEVASCLYNIGLVFRLQVGGAANVSSAFPIPFRNRTNISSIFRGVVNFS